MWPWQPIKLSDSDKSHKKREGLLNKHICKKNIQENMNISNETAEIVNLFFLGQALVRYCLFGVSPVNYSDSDSEFPRSHYKFIGNISCHSNQSSYPTDLKTQLM